MTVANTAEECRLSICIATRNRCDLLLETLRSIFEQIVVGVEVVVVDGASSDETEVVLQSLVAVYPQLHYYREDLNGGIDCDYDKAVNYASGTYCWLMSDDDLFLPEAITRVLDALSSMPSLVVVDAEVRDKSQTRLLLPSRCTLQKDRVFLPEDRSELLEATGSQLSFIGSTVLRREVWLSRDRHIYFGSYFIHVGVIFQENLPGPAIVLTTPCISIRYGNASWSGKSFEIWMFKWPELVWSLPKISSSVKASVVARAPYKSLRELVILRAKGAYSMVEYGSMLAPNEPNLFRRFCYLCLANTPGPLINLAAIAYVAIFSKARRFAMVDLLDSRYCLFRYLNRS